MRPPVSGGKARPTPKAKAKPKAAPKKVVPVAKRPPTPTPTPARKPPPPPPKTPTTTSSSTGTQSSTAAADPFAGTPYAGMSPYEIAQKIVNDEIQQQASAIQAAQSRQAQINQNQLSILSQLGVQLQQGAGQFANNYANTLGGLAGSFGTFSKGYQDQMAQFQQEAASSGAGGYTPTGTGGLQQAAADGSNVLQTALNSNPFTVLPSAYGRMAQMDANLLAANQSQQMDATYGQQIRDLYSGADSAILQEFSAIQQMFNDAQDRVSQQQAASAAAASAAAASKQKTYQWQWEQQQKEANNLTLARGILYAVDPNTLQVYEVKDPQGRPVVTVAGRKAGVEVANTRSEIANRTARLALSRNEAAALASARKQSAAQRQQSLNIQKQRMQEGRYTAAQEGVNRSKGYVMLYDKQTGQYVFARDQNGNVIPYKAPARGGPKVAGTQATTSQQGKLQSQQASVYSSAAKLAAKLSGQKGKNQYTGLPTGPAYSRAQVRVKVWNQYEKKFEAIATQMYRLGLIKVKPRAMAEYWINQVVAQAYR